MPRLAESILPPPPECRPGTDAKHRFVSACNFPATVCLVFRRAAYDALLVLDLNATFAEHRGQPWGEAWLVDSFRNHEEDVCPT
jgi:hypothetical protein